MINSDDLKFTENEGGPGIFVNGVPYNLQSQKTNEISEKDVILPNFVVLGISDSKLDIESVICDDCKITVEDSEDNNETDAEKPIITEINSSIFHAKEEDENAQVEDGETSEISSDSDGFAQFDDECSYVDEMNLPPVTNDNCKLQLRCWICKERMLPQQEIYCDCRRFERGSVHKKCLIEWMNSLCKGRCPTCRFKFRVKTHKLPFNEWGADPILVQSKKRYITMVTMNCVIIIVVVIVLVELLINKTDKKRARAIIAGILSFLFVIYMFYQIRLYHRVYERAKIYNNKVVDVLESFKDDEGTARRDMSSYIIRDLTI